MLVHYSLNKFHLLECMKVRTGLTTQEQEDADAKKSTDAKKSADAKKSTDENKK